MAVPSSGSARETVSYRDRDDERAKRWLEFPTVSIGSLAVRNANAVQEFRASSRAQCDCDNDDARWLLNEKPRVISVYVNIFCF